MKSIQITLLLVALLFCLGSPKTPPKMGNKKDDIFSSMMMTIKIDPEGNYRIKDEAPPPYDHPKDVPIKVCSDAIEQWIRIKKEVLPMAAKALCKGLKMASSSESVEVRPLYDHSCAYIHFLVKDNKLFGWCYKWGNYRGDNPKKIFTRALSVKSSSGS